MENRFSILEVRKYLMKYRLAQIDQDIQELKNNPNSQKEVKTVKEIPLKFARFYKDLDIIKSGDEDCDD